MKRIGLFFLMGMAMIFGACKKSSTAPSIVGAWKMVGISGTTAYKGTSVYALLITTNYIYNGSVLTVEDSLASTEITINNEAWSFNNDGTFSIYESYQADTTTILTTNIITGWWDYTGSTLPNSDLLLRALSSPTIVPAGGTFFIESVTNTQMVLNVNESTTSSVTGTNTKNLTLTFTKL